MWRQNLTVLIVALLLPYSMANAGDYYEMGTASRDGIGKFYLGREISHVMGHRGAGWLERSSREQEERTDLLLLSLDLQAGDVVADLGAGTGYFALPMARRVGEEGRVLAVDIQPQMLALIEQRMASAGVSNIDLVLATESDPKLPEGEVDLVLMVDAYHEFSHPREVMSRVVQSLAAGGRVVLVEYRGEDRSVPIKPLHKMTVAQAEREMAAAGLALRKVDDSLPLQHIMIFGRAGVDGGN
jgi:cyclopropane fatty-acyl-phospholipid synthase-like methyltransferase